mgnify:CR=1 FL=1
MRDLNETTANEINFSAKILKELAKMASNDPDRHQICVVNLDRCPLGNARLWATNGHCLVTYDLGYTDLAPKIGQRYGVEAIKALSAKARLTYCKEKSVLCDERGTIDMDEGNSPCIEEVIPKVKSHTDHAPVIGLGTKLLAKCMTYLSRVEVQGVKFHTPPDNLGPILMEGDKASAIIMPVRF